MSSSFYSCGISEYFSRGDARGISEEMFRGEMFGEIFGENFFCGENVPCTVNSVPVVQNTFTGGHIKIQNGNKKDTC